MVSLAHTVWASYLRNSATHVHHRPPTSMVAEVKAPESSWLFAVVHGCSPRVAVTVAVNVLLWVFLELSSLLPQLELTALGHDQAVYPLTHAMRCHIPLIRPLFGCSVAYHTICSIRRPARAVRDQRIQVAKGL